MRRLSINLKIGVPYFPRFGCHFGKTQLISDEILEFLSGIDRKSLYNYFTCLSAKRKIIN